MCRYYPAYTYSFTQPVQSKVAVHVNRFAPSAAYRLLPVCTVGSLMIVNFHFCPDWLHPLACIVGLTRQSKHLMFHPDCFFSFPYGSVHTLHRSKTSQREWRMPLKAVPFAFIRDWIMHKGKWHRLFHCSILFSLNLSARHLLLLLFFLLFFLSCCHDFSLTAQRTVGVAVCH